MKSRIIKNETGYHPGNITIGDKSFTHDQPPINNVTVIRDNVILYDANENPLIRKIGFK